MKLLLNVKLKLQKFWKETWIASGNYRPSGTVHADPDSIFKDPEIDIVIELLGGIEPATTFMLSAMENGKHVVTANKAAVAANFDKLMNTARENGVESSV